MWQSEVNNTPFDNEGLLPSDRAVRLIKKLGLGDKNLILESPFSTGRLNLWFSKKSVIALNGKFSFYTHIEKDSYELHSNTESFYVKVDEGIYFIQTFEEYLGNGHGLKRFLIFNNEKNQWDSDSVKKFLIKFSKELFLLWKKEKITVGDPTAFDALFLPEEVIKDFRVDFEDFLRSREMYLKDLRLPWKRGYMLIGPPGNGKTLLIRSVCNYYGLEYFDIKRVIDNGGNLNMEAAIESSVDYLLYPDEERPKVCILEDIDKFTAFQSGAAEQDYGSISLHSLLRGLDGVDSFSDIILMATSNFPDVLHEAIAGRPGRFDKIYSIDKPTESNIQKLLAHYRLTFDGCDAEFVSKRLLGSSMAFVAEFVKMAKMKYKRNNITMEEANKLLEGIKAHQKLCETHFKEERQVGFKK